MDTQEEIAYGKPLTVIPYTPATLATMIAESLAKYEDGDLVYVNIRDSESPVDSEIKEDFSFLLLYDLRAVQPGGQAYQHIPEKTIEEELVSAVGLYPWLGYFVETGAIPPAWVLLDVESSYQDELPA